MCGCKGVAHQNQFVANDWKLWYETNSAYSPSFAF